MARIAIEKIPRKSRKSLKSEEGDKVGKVPSELEPVVNPKRKIFDSGLQGEALASRQKKIKHSEDVFGFETSSSDSRVKMVVEEHPNRLMNSDQEANCAGRSENNLASLIQTQQDMNSNNSLLISTLLKTLDNFNDSRNHRHSSDSSADRMFKQIEKLPKFSGLPQENFEVWILESKPSRYKGIRLCIFFFNLCELFNSHELL